MRIEILGALRVVGADGTDITPRGAQQRRALTALALSSPSPVSVDAIEEILWPAGAPSANALQAVISKLRRVVAPGVIDGTSRGYVLSGVDIDLREFEHAVTAERWADIERSVSGDPLADLADTEFAAPDRARIAAAVRAARARRLSDAVEGPEPQAALAELERMVVVEPVDEGWWSLLMVALSRSGRRADALATYQRARRVLAEEVGLEPGPELRRAETRVLSAGEEGTVSPGLPSSPTTPQDLGETATPTHRWEVPAGVATFVGRALELSELGGAVDAHRMVTVVGPGGAGKTTIVLELCRQRPEDAVVVQFAAAADTDGVVRALTRAIGIPDHDAGGAAAGSDRDDAVARACAALRGRRILVVFDNCEHLIDEVADVAGAVLQACPEVRVIATSRELLGVPGEHAYPLPPLHDSEATTLFRERAGDHGIVLDVADDDLIGLVCARLDGLPLAIELAAARLRTRTLSDISDGLHDRFSLLTTGPRSAEPRQQTLRAVVDWSHDLLDPHERIVFRRLAVFVGGATLDGVRAVCAGWGDDRVLVGAGDVADVVDRLVDKSLVKSDRSGRTVRFTMLQTLADYADERLVESGERDLVLRRHAVHVADTLAPALRGLIGWAQADWMTHVAVERANIDRALDTAVNIDDAQLALDVTMPIGWYFYMSGDIDGGTVAFDRATSCGGETEAHDRAIALAFHGWLLANGDDIERAVSVAGEAMAMLDRVDDPWTRGLVANTYTMSQFFIGDLDEVEALRAFVDEATSASNDRWIEGITSVVRAEVTQYRGDVDAAERLFAEAAAAFEAVGDRFAYVLARTEASEIAEQRGDYDRAAELLREGIELAGEVGFSGHPLAMRARLGNIELLRGRLDEAERHHRELLGDAAAKGVPWLQSMSLVGLASVARRRGHLDEADHHLKLAWELPRSRSVPFVRTVVQVARGHLADQAGDLPQAFDRQADAMDVALGLGAPRSIAFAFEGVAGALSLSGDVDIGDLGARLLGHAHRLRVDSGGPMPSGERYDVDRAEMRLRALLGDARFDAQFENGVDRTVGELVAEVVALEPHVRRR